MQFPLSRHYGNQGTHDTLCYQCLSVETYQQLLEYMCILFHNRNGKSSAYKTANKSLFQNQKPKQIPIDMTTDLKVSKAILVKKKRKERNLS